MGILIAVASVVSVTAVIIIMCCLAINPPDD